MAHKLCKWSIYGCSHSLPSTSSKAIAAFDRHETEECTYSKVLDTSGRAASLWKELTDFCAVNMSMKGVANLRTVMDKMNTKHYSKRLRPLPFAVSGTPHDLSVPFLFSVGDVYTGQTKEGDPRHVPAKEVFGAFVNADIFDRLRYEDAAALQTSILNPSAAVYGTLARPTPPIVMGLAARNLPDRNRFTHPAWASTGSPIITTRLAYNATPAGSVKDLHLDHGYSHAGWCIGGRKIWLIYPAPIPDSFYKRWAEVQNSDFHDENYRLPLLLRMADRLMNPLIAASSDDIAVYLPPGCIHAVITVKAGYLGGLIWLRDVPQDYRMVGEVVERELKALAPLLEEEGETVDEEHWVYKEDIFPTLRALYKSIRAALAHGAIPADVEGVQQLTEVWIGLKSLTEKSPYRVFREDREAKAAIKGVEAALKKLRNGGPPARGRSISGGIGKTSKTAPRRAASAAKAKIDAAAMAATIEEMGETRGELEAGNMA